MRLATSSGNGSMSSVNGTARFCSSVNASRKTARSVTMPKRSTTASHSALSAIAAVGLSEHVHIAAFRQRCAGDEVDEHLGHRLVQADQRDVLAGRNRQLLNAERAKPAVVLRNAGELEGRRIHEPIRRFTSSTTRADRVSASISIFTAARFAAIAA